MRVPGRFALMATLAASILAAPGFLKMSDFLQRRWGRKQLWTGRFQGLLALCWIGLLIVELGFKPVPLSAIPTEREVPEVYRWLATKPLHGPIVELPLGESFWEALKYMYFSTYHWLPLVNGSSRFYPPTYTLLIVEIAALPSRESAERLSSIGVKAVIVHTDQLAPSETSRWMAVCKLGRDEHARDSALRVGCGVSAFAGGSDASTPFGASRSTTDGGNDAATRRGTHATRAPNGKRAL
jgi:hypothetical protein